MTSAIGAPELNAMARAMRPCVVWAVADFEELLADLPSLMLAPPAGGCLLFGWCWYDLCRYRCPRGEILERPRQATFSKKRFSISPRFEWVSMEMAENTVNIRIVKGIKSGLTESDVMPYLPLIALGSHADSSVNGSSAKRLAWVSKRPLGGAPRARRAARRTDTATR